MTIDEVYRILPKEQIIKTVGYGEHSGEDSYDDYLIYDYDGTLLLILTAQIEGTFSALIGSIGIKSEKFTSVSGIKIGSTFKEVRSCEYIAVFFPDIEHIVFKINWLNAHCSINKKELTQNWWNEVERNILPDRIDEESKIEIINICWV